MSDSESSPPSSVPSGTINSPTAEETTQTPDSSQQSGTEDSNSRKRKDRADSVDPEANGKKPRASSSSDNRDDEKGAGDGKEKLDEEAALFALIMSSMFKAPIPGPFHQHEASFPSVFNRRQSCDRRSSRESADVEFDGCVVLPERMNTTFEQVYTSAETIRALRLLTLSLNDPKAFKSGILAREATPGVMLYGPPGTGKTMLIRALAKEVGARMVVITAADIQSELVGVAEKKIQKLFSYARRNYPCIIFIDEADSCFRSRSAPKTPTHRVDFLNQFLIEMDGIDAVASNKPIVVAATNRPFDVDEGIMRRLGRRIMVGVPDARGREAILKLHLEGENLHPDVNLTEIAMATNDYTGSDLRDLVYQAAMAAVQEIHQQSDKAGEQANREENGPGPDRAAKKTQERTGADRILSRKHFLVAKKSISPAPKAELVAKIAEFHERYGSVRV